MPTIEAIGFGSNQKSQKFAIKKIKEAPEGTKYLRATSVSFGAKYCNNLVTGENQRVLRIFSPEDGYIGREIADLLSKGGFNCRIEVVAVEVISRR
jgi:hypothetical protein